MTGVANLEADHERLGKTTAQALIDEEKVQTQLNTLRDQIKQLRLEGKVLQQIMVTKKCATALVLKEFAKADCRKLCDKVYCAFPREVRDIVYSHIYPQREASVDRPTHPYVNSKRTYFESKSESHWRIGVESRDDRQLWEADTVGKGMLQELREQYYRAVEFQFGTDFGLIPRFQTTDQWKVGVIPADFVTNVAVAINCNRSDFDVAILNRETFRCGSPWCDWSDNNESSANNFAVYPCIEYRDKRILKTPRSILLSNLQTLFGFRKGTKISIRISAPGDLVDELTYIRDIVIPIILPTLRRLYDNGYKVKVVLWDQGWVGGFSNHGLEVDSSTLTLVAWKEKIQKFEIKMQKMMEEAELRVVCQKESNVNLDQIFEESDEE